MRFVPAASNPFRARLPDTRSVIFGRAQRANRSMKSSVFSGCMPAQRFVGVFAKELLVLLREPSQFEKSELGRGLGHARAVSIRPAKPGVHGAEPLVAKISPWAYSEHVGKGAMQRAAGNVQMRADFGDMDRTKLR